MPYDIYNFYIFKFLFGRCDKCNKLYKFYNLKHNYKLYKYKSVFDDDYPFHELVDNYKLICLKCLKKDIIQ